MTEEKKVTVVTSEELTLIPYLKKVWEYRSLILALARRDLKVKYAQTVLGILWSVLQPLTGLLIFTVFFDKLIQIDTLGIPYPLFAFSGMVSWFYFSYIVYSAGMSLTEAQDLMKKIYFPKLVLPLSKVLVGLVEFGISSILLVILMLIYGYFPSWPVFLFPIFILLNILVGLSISIWLSALTVRYRDFHHLIPYVVNFGIWLTPVFYPGTLIPGDFDYFLYLNPMAGVIAGFRWTLLQDVMPSVYYLLPLIPVLVVLVWGLIFFIKIEKQIVDRV